MSMCELCNKKSFSHRLEGKRLCCTCNVAEGGTPADWHPECLAAAVPEMRVTDKPFQHTPCVEPRKRLETAFRALLQNASHGDFTLIYDGFYELKRTERVFWRALRACHLIRSIMDMVDDEDKRRCSKTLTETENAGSRQAAGINRPREDEVAQGQPKQTKE